MESYAHEGKERVNNPPVKQITPDADRDAGAKTRAHDPHIAPHLSWAGKAEHTSFDDGRKDLAATQDSVQTHNPHPTNWCTDADFIRLPPRGVMRPSGRIFCDSRKKSRQAGEEGETMNANVSIPQEEIAAFCERWGVVEFALFGSVLRDDFTDESDVDVLIEFTDGPTPGLFGFVRMADELEELFGRKVDLVTRGAVENSRNPNRRKSVLESAQVVYAA